MRLHPSIFAAALVACATGPALSQTLLNKLENKLDARAPVTGATAPAAAPATGAPATEAPGAATPIPGYLGAKVDEAPETGKGVLLTEVKKGAPSELGGLKVGDIVVRIDGKPCRNLDDLDAALAKATIGTKLNLQIQRSGKVETKVITLGRRPIEAEPAADAATPPPPKPALPPTLSPASDPPATTPREPAASAPTLRPATEPLANDPLILPPPPGGERPASDPLTDPSADPLTPTPSDPATLDPAASSPTGKASLGIQVVPLNDETRAQYGIRSTARQGAVIVSVRPGSAADREGLPVGGVIVSIDGQLVKNSDDLVGVISAARPGQEVELRYYQGDRIHTKPVRLTPAAARGVVTAPPRPGMILGSSDQPLTRKFEDMVESLSPNTPPPLSAGSSIFDPSQLAEMHKDIKAMREQLDALDARVKALEAKGGGSP